MYIYIYIISIFVDLFIFWILQGNPKKGTTMETRGTALWLQLPSPPPPSAKDRPWSP